MADDSEISREIAEEIEEHFPLSKESFYKLQREQLQIKNPLSRAAVFYVLNRSSFSGTTLSGGMSPGHPRFTRTSIDRVRDFKVDRFTVQQADFRDSIAEHDNSFLYLDPPYLNGQALYGLQGDNHRGFNHTELAKILKKRDHWIMSYNDCINAC